MSGWERWKLSRITTSQTMAVTMQRLRVEIKGTRVRILSVSVGKKMERRFIARHKEYACAYRDYTCELDMLIPMMLSLVLEE